jgi:hypothetical protein
METQMTEFQSDTAGWSACRRIDRIREILSTFPEMTEEDGEVLAGCLSTLLRGKDLIREQENAYEWWDAWLKASDQGRFASNVGISLAVRDLPVVVHDELMEARQRLRRGEDMTPRQAACWGNHVVKRWNA